MATFSNFENTRTQTLSSSDRDGGMKVGSVLKFPDDKTLIYKITKERDAAKAVIVTEEHINNISQHPLSAVFGEKIAFTLLLKKARFDVWDAIGYGPNIRNFQGVMLHNRNLGPSISRFTVLNAPVDRAKLEEEIKNQTNRVNLPEDAFSGVINPIMEEGGYQYVYLLPQDLCYAVKLSAEQIADLQSSEYFRFYHHTGLAFLLETLNRHKYSIHWNGIGDIPELKSRPVLPPRLSSPQRRHGRPYSTGSSSAPYSGSSPYVDTSGLAFDDDDDDDVFAPEDPYEDLLYKAKSIGKDIADKIYKLLEPTGLTSKAVEDMIKEVDCLKNRCGQVRDGFDGLKTDDERFQKAQELVKLIGNVAVVNPEHQSLNFYIDYGNTLNKLMDSFRLRLVPVIHQVVVESGDAPPETEER